MRFDLDGLEVVFPYEYIYPEQYRYMLELKHALDARGHALLEMPTGTGKTISLLSLIVSYQAAHPEAGRLVYCTRTVPEMEKVLTELRILHQYRKANPGRYASANFARADDGDDRANGGSITIKRGGGGGSDMFAIGLSSRKNLCVNPSVVSQQGSRESVDSRCRNLTASWVRASARGGGGGGTRAGSSSSAGDAANGGSIEEQAARAADSADADVGDIEDVPQLCSFYENYDAAAAAGTLSLEAGIYTLSDLKDVAKARGWCPYFTARTLLLRANVIVYNYQYMLDPKVSNLVSRELERESIVVFDEAHNIDNVAIEALSVNIRQQTVDGAQRNLGRLSGMIAKFREKDAERLQEEYSRLVDGLASAAGGPLSTADREVLANPALPADLVAEAVPGSIRKAEHFVSLLRRLLAFFKTRLTGEEVTSETPVQFTAAVVQTVGIDAKTMRFCYDRLKSLMQTLEITDTDEFSPIQAVANLATLVGTYSKGFAIIYEPYDERLPGIPDPVLQLACLDASLAIQPVLERFNSVVITSGTLSPLDLYPKLLNFHPVISASLTMTLTRECICPIIVSRGADQQSISTRYEDRKDPGIAKNFGRLILEFAKVVPDGIVCFFVSYAYMDYIVSQWDELGILKELMAHKLIFIETQDVMETSLALDNFRKACDCGRGAIFFSIARGKVAEGIDFDRHYGRAVIIMGVPYQYTLSRILRARLEYLRENFQIPEADFLTFDAIRQASQCVGRVIRSKADYGLMIFADKRYQRHDKRSKLPAWITQHLKDSQQNLSTDMAAHMAQDFLRQMAQPIDHAAAAGNTLLSEQMLQAMPTALPH